MPSKRTNTTLKVSRRVMKHIESNSRPEESVDSTIRRLLNLGKNGTVAPVSLPVMKTIKISRLVMDLILKKAKIRESRDQTLGRLLGIAGDDGNVREQLPV